METNEPAPGARGASLQVWDSRCAPPKRAFAVFREGVCSSFMPWTPEPIERDAVFEGRIESVSVGDCAIGLSATSGLRAVKSRANIASSPVECVYGNYVLAGEMTLEQADRRTVAKAGDLVLYHSHRPTLLTEKAGASNRNLGFCVPVSRFADAPEMEGRCLNAVLTGERLIEPLAACLRSLSGNLRTASREEIGSVFDASMALLPLSLGCFSADPLPRRGSGGLMAAILEAIDDRLADPGLTPARVAAKLGISTRLLHKQFARTGGTFGRHVTQERLERIRGELMSAAGRRAPISAIAFRWGFNDLSTFNRAFRRRFGASPRALR